MRRTGILVNKVDLKREVLVLEAVLAGSVEVELEELVALAIEGAGKLGVVLGGELDGLAGVDDIKLAGDEGPCLEGERTGEVDVRVGDHVDGGLVLAGRADLVLGGQRVPDDGAGGLVVAVVGATAVAGVEAGRGVGREGGEEEDGEGTHGYFAVELVEKD